MLRKVSRRGSSRREFLGMAAAAGVGLPLLGSCASGVTESDGGMDQVDLNVPSQYQGREQNVAIWSAFAGVNGESLEALIAKFNDSQEDIYAEVQYQGDYWESSSKLTSAIQSRLVPDIAVMSDIHWGTFLFNDLLEPLDDYFDDRFNKEVYVDALINEGVAKGQLYWVSIARSTPLFYYNRDRFAEAGLPDRGPETWTELREWGAELTQLKVEGQPLKVHAFTSKDDWQFQAATWQFGGRFSEGLDVKIDGDAAIAAGEWQQRFVFGDDMAYLSESPSTDFSNGLIATAMDSTGVLRAIYENAQFEVGASQLPAEETTGVPTGGSGLVVVKGIPQERKDAALEVIRFLAAPENSAAWTLATGYLPVIKAAVDEPDLAAKMTEDPNFSVAIDQLPGAQASDRIRAFVPGASDTIIDGLQRIFSSGNEDVESAFGNVADRLRRAAEDVEDDYQSYFEA